jgi:hypothetical protein
MWLLLSACDRALEGEAEACVHALQLRVAVWAVSVGVFARRVDHLALGQGLPV